MANVLVEEKTMTDIANAIREKSGTVERMKPTEMPQAIDSISTDSSLIKLLEETNTLIYKFTNTSIEEIPKFKINPKCTSMESCFNVCRKLKCFDNNFDTSKLTSMALAFASNSSLGYVKGLNTQSAINMNYLFNACDMLTGVNTLDLSNIKSIKGLFNGCSKLTNISFVESSIKISISFSSSPLLSNESIQSIINGLADLTGQTAQTITFHSDVKNKLTEEQIASVTSKNWSIA